MMSSLQKNELFPKLPSVQGFKYPSYSSVVLMEQLQQSLTDNDNYPKYPSGNGREGRTLLLSGFP